MDFTPSLSYLTKKRHNKVFFRLPQPSFFRAYHILAVEGKSLSPVGSLPSVSPAARFLENTRSVIATQFPTKTLRVVPAGEEPEESMLPVFFCTSFPPPVFKRHYRSPVFSQHLREPHVPPPLPPNKWTPLFHAFRDKRQLWCSLCWDFAEFIRELVLLSVPIQVLFLSKCGAPQLFSYSRLWFHFFFQHRLHEGRFFSPSETETPVVFLLLKSLTTLLNLMRAQGQDAPCFI